MSEKSRLMVLVIGDVQRGIGAALEEGWIAEQTKATLPSRYFNRKDPQWATSVDELTFIARYGRAPLEGEIGCAAAHLDAYEVLLQSNCEWGLVFESDAKIVDSVELQNIVESVTQESRDEDVVSLYSESPIFAKSVRRLGSVPFVELRTVPDGTVAYLINRRAAASFIEAQTPIGSVSDWPLSTMYVNFGFVRTGAIRHSTDTQESTVTGNVDRSSLVPVRVRIYMWIGLWYVLHRNKFAGFRDYFDRVMRPRLVRRFQKPIA